MPELWVAGCCSDLLALWMETHAVLTLPLQCASWNPACWWATAGPVVAFYSLFVPYAYSSSPRFQLVLCCMYIPCCMYKHTHTHVHCLYLHMLSFTMRHYCIFKWGHEFSVFQSPYSFTCFLRAWYIHIQAVVKVVYRFRRFFFFCACLSVCYFTARVYAYRVHQSSNHSNVPWQRRTAVRPAHVSLSSHTDLRVTAPRSGHTVHSRLKFGHSLAAIAKCEYVCCSAQTGQHKPCKGTATDLLDIPRQPTCMYEPCLHMYRLLADCIGW